MIFLEIALLVIGLGAIIFSFYLSSPKTNAQDGSVESLTKEELQDIEKKYEDLKEKTQDAFDQLEAKLSEMSNEKIMGMSEYSDQVIDKIEKNHGEVVFLYDMLNEKQEEMKEFITKIDSMKADIHDEAAKEYQKLKQEEETLDRLRDEMLMENIQSRESYADTGEFSQKVSLSEEELLGLTSGEETLDSKESSPVFSKEEEKEEENAPVSENRYQPLESQEPIKNHNEEIIALYKKGRSVLDISKMLSLGQGEVKLVIDMYNAQR